MATPIKVARIEADMSQQEMAEKMGVHVQTYAKLEKNPDMMTIDDAKLFASIVGRDVSDLFFADDSN